MMKRLTVAACLAPVVCSSALGQVTARDPLRQHRFSWDLQTRQVAVFGRHAGDIMIPPGPLGFPTVEVPAINHALVTPNDELDGLSTMGVTNPTLDETFVILFSVDRTSDGLVDPDSNLVALGFPFNVKDQAAKNQAAGDEFMSLVLFTRTGPIPPGRSLSENNTLVFNHGDAGGVDYNVSFAPESPEDPIPPAPDTADVDAGMGATPGAALTARGVPGYPPFFFSVSTDSPSLELALPPPPSGASVFIDFIPDALGGEQLYAAPVQLGLVGADDINALIVFDNGNGTLNPNLDQLLFTLRPGSPSLGTNSPATIFSSRGNATFNVYAQPRVLGLRNTDVIDMLDWVRCDDILTCVNDWAIGYVCPCGADLNNNGAIDLGDLSLLLSFFGQQGGLGCPFGDLDNDRDTDIGDLAYLLAKFGQPCP
ncbi:MAG: hypothetical protein IT450_15190 [Phycisphaerales bacterium]|nr:hypothetical protein [Phycisphaerales bacterium]